MKLFGEEAVAALFKEYTQLHNKKVFEPIKHSDLTVKNKLNALNAITLIKVKRDGVIMGRNCADGSKKKIYTSKEETSSPTVALESLLLTFVLMLLKTGM